jgi:hypothetical protein
VAQALTNGFLYTLSLRGVPILPKNLYYKTTWNLVNLT